MTDSGKFIGTLYGKMALMSVLALAGNFLAQIIGTIIAGNILSDSALTVVGIATPVYYAYGAAGAMLGIGCAALCAYHIGKSEFDTCRRVFSMTYILVLVFALLLSALVFLFIDPLCTLLGATSENVGAVKSYVLALSGGGLGVMLIFPAFNILRMDGRGKTAVCIFLISGTLSVALTYIFLTHFMMGAYGVAIALCIGSGIAGLIGTLVLFTKSENFRPLWPDKWKETIKSILSTGTPGALEYFCFFICMLTLNNLLASRFGTQAVATYKVTDSIGAFALIFIWGIVGPLTPLAGVFGAERDTQSLREVIKLALRRGLLVIVPLTLLLVIFAPVAAGLFGLSEAQSAVRVYALSLPVALLNHILIYLYMGSQRTLLANTLLISRMAIWVITCAILFSLIGERAFWWCFLAAEILTLLTALLLGQAIRKLNINLTPLLLINISAERDGRYTSFSVDPATEAVAKAAAGVTDFCETNELSPKVSMAISLAIEEMLVVIFENSQATSANVRVLYVPENKIIVLRVRNGGKLFCPVSFAEKAGPEAAMEVMGINMILKLALNVDYRSTFGVNNTTIIISTKEGLKKEKHIEKIIDQE